MSNYGPSVDLDKTRTQLEKLSCSVHGKNVELFFDEEGNLMMKECCCDGFRQEIVDAYRKSIHDQLSVPVNEAIRKLGGS